MEVNSIAVTQWQLLVRNKKKSEVDWWLNPIDEDMILRGWAVFVMDRRTDRQADICNSKVAFMTENVKRFWIVSLLDSLDSLRLVLMFNGCAPCILETLTNIFYIIWTHWTQWYVKNENSIIKIDTVFVLNFKIDGFTMLVYTSVHILLYLWL